MTRSVPNAWLPPPEGGRARAFWQLALSQYVTNGLAVGTGLLLIALGVSLVAGLAAAAAAAAGVVITSVPDTPSPRRRKVLQVLPAPLLGLPLFLLVQLNHGHPAGMAAVLVGGSFLAALLTAWGKRGGPVSFAMIFAMVMSMATPAPIDIGQAWERTRWFAIGAALYLSWSLATVHLLNRRYRRQLLAEALISFSRLLRTQALRFDPQADPQTLLPTLLAQQATLADQIQNARDLVFESPTTLPRQQLAAMLLALLEARDHLLACELDLDFLLGHEGADRLLPELRVVLAGSADSIEDLGMALLRGRTPAPPADLRPLLSSLFPPAVRSTPAADLGELPEPEAVGVLRNIADRVGHINDEAVKLTALARGERQPEVAAVRSQWQLFVSPVHWSWQPLRTLAAGHAPVLRHALRTALAIGTGYGVSLCLPWATHKYWIVLTIAVVLRASLAQTVARGHARVLGTLIGGLLAMALLAARPGPLAMLLLLALGTTFAHGLAMRLSLVAWVGSAVQGLLQAQMLLGDSSPVFAAGERLGDTVIGALLAWAFSYVLPSWERQHLTALVRRTVAAQARHARLALALGQPQAPDLEWRLARREAYDSLSALTLAAQRTQAEPPSVRLPLAPLETLLARSYQLLAQLAAVKGLLVLRRAQLQMDVALPALQQAAQRIAAELGERPGAGEGAEPPLTGRPYAAPPDPLTSADLTPWLLRRLGLACAMARELRVDVERLQPSRR